LAIAGSNASGKGQGGSAFAVAKVMLENSYIAQVDLELGFLGYVSQGCGEDLGRVLLEKRGS